MGGNFSDAMRQAHLPILASAPPLSQYGRLQAAAVRLGIVPMRESFNTGFFIAACQKLLNETFLFLTLVVSFQMLQQL